MRPLLCLIAAALVSTGVSCRNDPPPPPPPECGNGLLETGEACEGMPPPPGCDDETCTVEMGWACTPEPPSNDGETSGGAVEPMEWSSTCEELETCGDGAIDPDEDCDDGNLVVMDGCSGCRPDPQWTCMGQPSECYTCGDGFRNPGEACDDGELVPNQDYDSPGCLNCMVVPGWECFPSAMAVDLCGPVCGDGMWFDTSIDGVTAGFAEGCDDGNLMDGDGCDGSCNVEDGWVCESTAPETSVCYVPEESTGTDSGSSGTDSGSSGGTGTSTGGSTGTGTTGSTG